MKLFGYIITIRKQEKHYPYPKADGIVMPDGKILQEAWEEEYIRWLEEALNEQPK